MNEEFEGLIDVKEAARMFGLTIGTTYRYAKLGVIPAIKIGDVLRFDRWTILKWIRNENRSK